MILFDNDSCAAYVLERYDEIGFNGCCVTLTNYSRDKHDQKNTNSYEVLAFVPDDAGRTKTELYEINEEMFNGFKKAVESGAKYFDLEKAYEDAAFKIDQRKHQ